MEDAMSPRNRKDKLGKRQGPSLLNEVLERRMVWYVLAAGATLAGASAAQAKVVFTQNNTVVQLHQHLDIDIDNDGKTDFTLSLASNYLGSSLFVGRMGASAKMGNGINNDPVNGFYRHYALAFTNGAHIGGSGEFHGLGVMAESVDNGYTHGFFGNTTSRFLGVRLLINGVGHYGWIGFRGVSWAGGSHTATLEGWAYETNPNMTIRAGDTGEEESAGVRAAEPTSLELLATGNMVMTDWRRRRAA
jgi:hypothetical protein